jgi:hypothetical protein
VFVKVGPTTRPPRPCVGILGNDDWGKNLPLFAIGLIAQPDKRP